VLEQIQEQEQRQSLKYQKKRNQELVFKNIPQHINEDIRVRIKGTGFRTVFAVVEVVGAVDGVRVSKISAKRSLVDFFGSVAVDVDVFRCVPMSRPKSMSVSLAGV
jgi:hypothetical protein